MCPGVDSASENEYQGFLLGYGWRTTTLVVPNVKEIQVLNLPGTPWATAACRGMTFTFTFTYYIFILDKLQEYKRNWMHHVNIMLRNRLPRVMKQYFPTSRRNHGRPLKSLLDAWDRNGSTSGPIPWKTNDDDDDDDDDDYINIKSDSGSNQWFTLAEFYLEKRTAHRGCQWNLCIIFFKSCLCECAWS